MVVRRLLALVAALALTMVGLVPSSVAPAPAARAAAAWHVNAGAGTPDSAVTSMAFYPEVITIDVGDSITWTMVGEAHTVTFLSGQPRPSPLAPQTAAPAGGSTYDGTAFTNSGIVPPGGTYTLTFTKAGTFPYVCLLHGPMQGTVVVQPAGTPYPLTQGQYDVAAAIQSQHDLIAGISAMNAANPSPNTSTNADGSTNYSVWAATGSGISDVMRFLPNTLTIHVGDTVTWTAHGMEPHTVTFAPDGKFPAVGPQAFTPAGGNTYDGSTFTNSGLIVPQGVSFPGVPTVTSYTLKFTKPGVYVYACLLHDEAGMIGKIRVVAAGASTSPGTPLVTIGVSAHLGPVLTDAQGRTLYFLTSEAGGQPIKCTGKCLGFWPPVGVSSASTDAVEGPGLTGVLTVDTRQDGINQVSYGELPLYTFAGDKAPGDTNGEGIPAFGGVWLAARPTTTPLITPVVVPSGSGMSASFVVSFLSSKPGAGQVDFGSGPGCSGLVGVATQDQDPGSTTHTVQVQGNEIASAAGDNGIQPGATYWFELVTTSSAGQQVDNNNGQCYSVTIPKS